jgi:4'-phosphopantetheinyl transferase
MIYPLELRLTPGAGRLPITADEMHLWCAHLPDFAADERRYRATLARAELARAEHFHFELHRRRFMLARGALRALLARYLDEDPRRLAFTYGPYGKPELVARPGWPDLRFNLSHADDLALYAVAVARAVGVDLEPVQSDFDHLAVASHAFTPDERAALAALPPQRRPAYFFTCWTRKEALSKAHGGGIALPLTQIEVGGAPAPLTRLVTAASSGVLYHLYDLSPAPGFAASCAVVGLMAPARFQEGLLVAR